MPKKAGGGIARLPLKSPSPRQPPAEPQTLVVPVFFPLYPPTWKPLPPPGSCQPSVPLSSGDTVPVTSPIFIFQSTPIGDFPSNQAPGGFPLPAPILTGLLLCLPPWDGPSIPGVWAPPGSSCPWVLSGVGPQLPTPMSSAYWTSPRGCMVHPSGLKWSHQKCMFAQPESIGKGH